MRKLWVRRRWTDFRLGHGIYLIFLLSFSNFVLIFYRLLVEKIEFLGGIFSSLWFFVIVFILIYIPVAILIGLWHRRTQVSIETDLVLRNNPFMARNFRILVDILEGKASKEEIDTYRKMLKSIERGKGGLDFQEKSNKDDKT